jgi:intracellular septation protein
MNSHNKRLGLTLLFGGLLPVIAFTVIEDRYGIIWGAIAGITFGIGETLYEKIRFKKVSKMTWITNGFILFLGGISIIAQDGIWFKLQPALIEFILCFFLWGSLVAKKPLLMKIAEAQGQNLNTRSQSILHGLTFRLGLFFFVQSLLATWAALQWTTEQWAWLKGAGLAISFILYMGTEFLVIRWLSKK